MTGPQWGGQPVLLNDVGILMNDRPPMGWAAGLVDDTSQSVPTSGNAQQDAGGLWDLEEMIVRPPMGWAAGLDD